MMSTRLDALVWALLCIAAAGVSGARYRPSKCGQYEFACKSGPIECIELFDNCDGKKDCADGSDETATECRDFDCGRSPFSFRCAYGACIDANKQCDDKFDCADGSDEVNCAKIKEAPERTSRCQYWEFTCKSGSCVNLTDVCDGTPNCSDGSDETIEECTRMTCSSFAFRCAYGACIDSFRRCDDHKDCNDGSDEEPLEECNREQDAGGASQPTINKSTNDTTTCLVPSAQNTIYKLGGCKDDATNNSCRLLPGTPVKKLKGLKVSCPPGYELPRVRNKTINAMQCFKPPAWSPNIKCERMCSPLAPLTHTLNVNITCEYGGKDVPCDQQMRAGTLANVRCKKHFIPQHDTDVIKYNECRHGGQWSNPSLFKCIPEGAGQETTPRPLGTRLGAQPQSLRVTQRMIMCLGLFDAGLLPQLPTTTPPPRYTLFLGGMETRVRLYRYKRQTSDRYRRIIHDMNALIGSTRSLLEELNSLFIVSGSPPKYNYDELEEVMDKQNFERGLAQCRQIDDATLFRIIDDVEKRRLRSSMK